MFALVEFKGEYTCPKKTDELVASEVMTLSSLREIFLSVKLGELSLPWTRKLPILVKFR
jgi:hypothetical protein